MISILDGRQRKICIWGTGQYAEQFISKVNEYRVVFERVFCIDLFDEFACFMVSHPKERAVFYNWSVEPVDEIVSCDDYCFVLAMADCRPAYRVFEERGIGQERYESIYEYYYDLNAFLIRNKKTILDYCGTSLSKDSITRYVQISYVIEQIQYCSDSMNCFQEARKKYGDATLMGLFSWYYYDNTQDIIDKIAVESEIITIEKPCIGIIVNCLHGGGVERTASLLTWLFSRNDHKVVVIVDEYDDGKDYKLPDECDIHIMKTSIEGSIEERTRELIECISDYGINVLCFHWGYVNYETFYYIWAAKLNGVKTILEIRSSLVTILEKREERSAGLMNLYRMADRVITVSRRDQKVLESAGCRGVYIQNPIDIQGEEVLRRQCLKKTRCGTNRIIWVGRLVQANKNVFDVVPIMKYVAQANLDATLTMYGEPQKASDYELLQEKIQDAGLIDTILFGGYKNNMDEVYENADVILCTSLSEGFPNVIFESKCWGIPLVMYDLPDVELTKDGEGYIGVEKGDTKAAADAIIKILKDLTLYRRLSMEAFDSAIRFVDHDVYNDWGRVFDELFDL